MVNEGEVLKVHKITLSKQDMENFENEMSMLMTPRTFSSAAMPVMITPFVIL